MIDSKHDRSTQADLPDRDRWPAARRALVLAEQERLDRELELAPLVEAQCEPTLPGVGLETPTTRGDEP